MKKLLAVLALFATLITFAQADTATMSLTVTNGQAITYSDQISASGYLDKIEVVQDAAATSTVTVATYSGTTSVESYASLSGLATATKLIRPRVLPTDNTGTAIASVAGTGTNTLTQLNVPYQMPLIGGNLKLAVTGTANDGANTVTVTLYYIPIKK